MSAFNGNKPIDLLFGVAGEDSLDHGSGEQIKKSIDGIVKNLHNNKHTELTFTVSDSALKKLRADIEKSLQNLKVTVVYGDGTGTGGTSDTGNKPTKTGSDAERQKNIRTLQQLHRAIQQFDALASKPTTIAIANDTQLSAFIAKVETIKHELAKAGLEAAKADYNLDQLAEMPAFGDMLTQVQDMTMGVRNLTAQTGGLATANMKLETSYHKLANRAYDYMTRIQSSLSRDPAMMKEMEQLIDKLHQGKFSSVAEGAQEFQKLQFRIKQAGLEAETLNEQIKRVFQEKFGFGVMATAALYARRSISDIYKTVVNLDTKLTELKIVSGATGEAMVKYFDKAAEAAKRVAASITDIIDATTVYRRLGFEMSKSLDFAELTTMYSKVGNVDMSEAEENITAIIKAFDLDSVEKLRLAMDQLVKTGNDYAIDARGLGIALQDAASALVAAGNSYEESLALLTAANTVTQDASKSGTALRTISSRLRQSATELEELGEELDVEYNTTSKYREKLMAMSGVDILEDDMQTYKSTIQILRELAAVWDDLSDIDKSSITYMVAGKRTCPNVQKCA